MSSKHANVHVFVVWVAFNDNLTCAQSHKSLY